jgi:hypothetical protein
MSKRVELLDTKSNPFPNGTSVHLGGEAEQVVKIEVGTPVEVPDEIAAMLLADFPRAFKVSASPEPKAA